MKTRLIVFFILLSLFLGFVFGAGYGAYKITYKLISIGSDVLDIKLTDKAKSMLISNPELIRQAVSNSGNNYTNPFSICSQYQAHLHYEDCVLRGYNLTACEIGLKAKYGDGLIPFR